MEAARRGRMTQAIEWAFPIRTKGWRAGSIPTGLAATHGLMATAGSATAPALVPADSVATGRQPTVTPARTGRRRRIMARDLRPKATGLQLRAMVDTTPRRLTAVRHRITAPFRRRILLLRVARVIPRRDPIRRRARASRLRTRAFRRRALPVAARTSPEGIRGSPVAIQAVAAAMLPAVAILAAEAAVTIDRTLYRP